MSHTKNNVANKYYDLNFPDMLVHYFQDEIYGSIILDICEYSIDEFLHEYSKQLETKVAPIFQFTTFFDDDFWIKLKDNSLIYYAISASYGFNGIVVSKKIQVIEI